MRSYRLNPRPENCSNIDPGSKYYVRDYSLTAARHQAPVVAAWCASTAVCTAVSALGHRLEDKRCAVQGTSASGSARAKAARACHSGWPYVQILATRLHAPRRREKMRQEAEDASTCRSWQHGCMLPQPALRYVRRQIELAGNACRGEVGEGGQHGGF